MCPAISDSEYKSGKSLAQQGFIRPYSKYAIFLPSHGYILSVSENIEFKENHFVFSQIQTPVL
jgi:hypothetical protein